MFSKVRILMSLVIILLLSSFFFIESYREKIVQARISAEQLSRLDAIEFLTDANERLAKLRVAENRRAWLHLAQLYGKENADIAFGVAEYYLKQDNIISAKLWLKQAIRQQHQEARLTLAAHYFKTKQYRKSKSLLLPILDNERALVLLYKLAMQLGDTAFMAQHQTKLARSENSNFYQQLRSFSIFSTAKNKINQSCQINVQLFATNLAGLQHGEKLTSQFQQHKLSAYICLQAPKYIPSHELSCQTKPQQRISCQADVWATRTDISSRYIGLIAEKGGANVDNGIMYIDQQDGVDVLAHELSHLLGFIDEYPLPSQHQKCQQSQQSIFSHNLVTLPNSYYGERAEIRKRILLQLPWASLIKDSTPILIKHDKAWKLATPLSYQHEVGIFSARTCDKSNKVQAYKPYAYRTQLEYFELGFPQSYIDIMAIAPKQYLMPSYHFNVSRDLALQGEYSAAREVLRAIIFH
jgi:hypothetical protein